MLREFVRKVVSKNWFVVFIGYLDFFKEYRGKGKYKIIGFEKEVWMCWKIWKKVFWLERMWIWLERNV